MIAGIAAVVKSLKPQIQVIGVEPTGANAMAQSLVRGERVTLSKVDAFAGGLQAQPRCLTGWVLSQRTACAPCSSRQLPAGAAPARPPGAARTAPL